MNSLSGCLLVNKRKGFTSRQEVNEVSHRLHEKKVGHIGTLDPFAEGLLIIMVGRATKISQLLENDTKTYIATLKLGVKTDTADIDGNVIETKDVPDFNKQIAIDVLNTFLGESEQLPPMYSALKKDGLHYYDYARKGIEIERKARKINVFSISLVSFEKDEITFIAKVSKGTYIRTLGEDIASRLGTVGHLSELKRIAIGDYSLNDAKQATMVSEADLISIEDMLKNHPSIELNDKEYKMASNGMHLKLNAKEDTLLVKYKSEIIALYVREHNNVFKCLRGLK